MRDENDVLTAPECHKDSIGIYQWAEDRYWNPDRRDEDARTDFEETVFAAVAAASQRGLDAFQALVGMWGEGTFPDSRIDTIVNHFHDEAAELMECIWDYENCPGNDGLLPFENPDYAAADEEAADCVLLLLHYCHRRGVSLMELMQAKMQVNKARTWGQPDERGVVRHVESEDDNGKD